ncbi:MAG TPA: phosphatase PAP2 family protein [Thermoanaerobaculia bacterium]|jgi:undecaprenyl-diphosphatase
MSTAAKRRYASAGFVALVLLSVFWPSPVVSSNQLWMGEPLAVDHVSFLGREAPSWDVVFWCVAGLYLLMMLHGAESYDFGDAWQQLRATRIRLHRRDLVVLFAGAAIVAAVWLLADAPVLAWAERVQSDFTEDLVRLFNRFGGGANPGLIVLFFLVAGVCYRERRWVSLAVAMALAGLGAGILAQVVKALVSRARPELWLGPFAFGGPATSFPSGHTVGAFALAGVLLFGARSPVLRASAIVLAAMVGISRILAFRHWTSDVTASAIIGLFAASVITAGVIGVTNRNEVNP